MFPEIRTLLSEAFARAEEGAEFVITRCRDDGVNWRTQMERIISRAGLEQWPKIFQNLRSTRQSELEDIFPSHVVCAWMGNSPAVAARHYLQVTDEHFDRANALEGVAQNPAQQVVTSGPKSSPGKSKTTQKLLTCDEVGRHENPSVAGAGLEPAQG